MSKRFSWVVWVAQGFGIGTIRFAPGTWGSILGLIYAFFLLRLSFPFFVAASLGGVIISIWIGAQAEKILNCKDPGSIVIDEICAMPFCFLPFAVKGLQPGWLYLAVGFGLFRLFDIWKPWPIRQSQKLPGGWGLTVDDVLAALLVAAILSFV